MNKFPECENCRMKDDEPHVCELCDNADMFEPYENEFEDPDEWSGRKTWEMEEV